MPNAEQIHSFTLQRRETIEEIHSTVSLYRHDRLGTKVFAIKNDDPNKTFCIAFQTVPEDSTGVAHILEHSVLMGSEKYPVRDVFGEINKGGLMTFLNAMTGSDTTWYPFATRNLKEYFNIMDVYCDVCLHPLLERSTFDQEGWHFHLEDASQPLRFQGVVYNEMKGAYSDPLRAIFHNTFQAMLPGSTYAKESGGDPVHIPDLSYEQFVNFHHKHYHPSNSTVFFYGDAPLDEELAFLDNVLSGFTDAGKSAEIIRGTPIQQPVQITQTYGVQPDSTLEGKTFLAVSTAVGDFPDRTARTCFQIIANILYNSDASPLKKAIVEADLCKDFGGLFLADSCFQTIMMTYLIGSDPGKREPFLEVYNNSLQSLINEGLDADLVLSELNKYEFGVREELNKAQRGLDLISHALPALKFDTDPFEALEIESLFSDIRRRAIEENLFISMIEKHLIDNPATVVLTLEPDLDKLQQTAAQEQERLDQYRAQLNENSIGEILNNTISLQKMQITPNSDHELAMLPSLELQDLDPTPDFFQVEAGNLCGQPLLISEIDTNGICYLDIGFDCSALPQELLSYLDLFGTIVTEIGTESKDYIQLAKEIGIYTGGLTHSFSTYVREGEIDCPRPVFWLHLKTLSRYLDEAVDLLLDILASSQFTNQRRIAEICQREFAWAEHTVQSEGYSLAATRVFAHLSKAGRINEEVSGATPYLLLKHLVHEYPENEANLLESLQHIATVLFAKNNLIVSIAGSDSDITRLKDKEISIVNSLSNNNALTHQPYSFLSLPERQAFTTSSEVVYNVLGGNLFPEGAGYNGHFEVLKTWLSRDYLWNTVRQAGGAYGCFMQFSHISGNCTLISYRDPEVAKTFAAYQSIGENLEKLKLTDAALKQLIIGTYGKFNPHQSPAAKAATARNEYLTGITSKSKQKRLSAILTTTAADLRGFADNFKKLSDDYKIATIGNRQKIQDHSDLFSNIQTL